MNSFHPYLFSCLLLLSLASLILPFADAADAGNWQIDYSGSLRGRYSTLHNQFRPGLSKNDQALSLLALMKIDARHNNWSVVGELEDARNYLNDAGSALSTIEINTLEPLQAYVQYRQALEGSDYVDVKVGRHTMDMGSRRLIARNRYRNTSVNYNGLNVHWQQNPGHAVTAFWVLPVLIRPAGRADLLDNRIELDEEDPDLQFWGVFYKSPALWRDLQLEGYLFGLHERDDPGDRQTRDRELLTPGLRLIRLPASAQWDVDAELTFQRGTRRATANNLDTRTLDVSANFVHLALGYTFVAGWWPRVSLEYDFGSGDDNRADLSFGRFDSLFGPRRADFGPTGIYGPMGRENTRSLGLRLGFNFSSRTDGYVSWRHNRLDSATDSFSRTGVSDILGQSGTDAGDQWEFRFRHWLQQDKLRLEAGGAWFDQGSFLQNAPDANGFGDPVFFYTDLTLSF